MAMTHEDCRCRSNIGRAWMDSEIDFLQARVALKKASEKEVARLEALLEAWNKLFGRRF
jgi:hypothetical protein